MTNGSIILAIFLVTIALSFLYTAANFLWQIAVLVRELRGINQAIKRTSGEHVQLLEKSSVLGEAWKGYFSTFLVFSGDTHKTERTATGFFRDNDLISRKINLRIYLAMPNILVGIGVLGTFVGLAFGISDFDTESVEGVRESISTLLAGMSTAFLTSIAGMFTSIVFNLIEKSRFKVIALELRQITSQLDGRYLLTLNDRLKIQKEEAEKQLHAQGQLLSRVLGRLFVYRNESGQIVTPNYVFRDLKTEAQQQTAALKAFSTDLADSITLSMETIADSFGRKVAGAFQHTVKNSLQPTLEKVHEALSGFGNNQQDMTQQVIGDLKAAIEQMGEQFRDVFVGGALEQLSGVAQTLEHTGGIMTKVPLVLNEIMNKFNQEIRNAARKAGEESIASSKQIRENIVQAVQAVSNESVQTGKAMQKEVQGTFEQFKVIVEDIQQRSQGINEQQSTQNKYLESMTAQIQQLQNAGHELTNRVQQAAGKMTEMINRLDGGLQSIDGAAKSLGEVGNTLGEVTDEFREEHRTMITSQRENHDRQRQSLQELIEALKRAEALGADYAAKFGVIQNGLKEIFGEIQTGLTAYQTETRDSLGKYLMSFSEKLESASGSLAGAVEALNEVVEDLTDGLDKSKAMPNGRR